MGALRSPRFARLARCPDTLFTSLSSLAVCLRGVGTYCSSLCGAHGDFLNPFRKSPDVYGVYCKCLLQVSVVSIVSVYVQRLFCVRSKIVRKHVFYCAVAPECCSSSSFIVLRLKLLILESCCCVIAQKSV